GHYGTVLQAVSYTGKEDIIKLLLENGADPDMPTENNCSTYGTVLKAAVYNGNLDVVKLLLDSGADPNNRGGNVL
ncbi:hypothetical protein C8R44DRAFT_629654, partial [Mycena epipterygia]